MIFLKPKLCIIHISYIAKRVPVIIAQSIIIGLFKYDEVKHTDPLSDFAEMVLLELFEWF